MACEAIKDMVSNGVHSLALFEDTLQIDADSEEQFYSSFIGRYLVQG
jgi:hypothetical protein